MEVEIYDKDLLELYLKGKSRKYILPKEIIEKYYKRINDIHAAKNIYDLWSDKAINFEKLTNLNLYSMKLNNRYRLEMKIEWENDNKTIGTFIITGISKHYE